MDQKKNVTSGDIYDVFPELKNVENRGEGELRSVRSYVLRTNRLSQSLVDAVKKGYPRFGLGFAEESVDTEKIFGNCNPLVIEIGFGMGESTAEIAARNPDINYLAIDVFLNGFASLLRLIEEKGLKNVRVMRHDAVEVIEKMISDGSVSGFHIFFPDPWPKKRHFKRRLINPAFLGLLSQKLAPDGYIYMVTDWSDYATWMLDAVAATPSLTNPYGNGFCPSVPWRPKTAFERKGLEQNNPISEIWVTKSR